MNISTSNSTGAPNRAGSRSRARALVAGAGVAVLALGVGACSGTAAYEDEDSVDEVLREDAPDAPFVDAPDADLAYGGVYDSEFVDEQDSYVGQEVALSADVGEVISDRAFTITGDGVDDLLVISSQPAGDLGADQPVQASGTVEETFSVETVEQDLGIDLDDDLYRDVEGDTYLMAGVVDTGVLDP